MEFVFEETVRMYDVDVQGITHYSSYYRFFTDAIEQFSINLFGRSMSIIDKDIWFVTVSSKANYLRPTYLDDKLLIKMTVKLISKSVIKFKFKIFDKNELCITGEIVQVAIDRKKWKSTTIPKEISEKFRENR